MDITSTLLSMSKLPRKRVLEIRAARELGYSAQEIADGFGLHRHTVENIINGKTHKDVKPGEYVFPVDEQTAQTRARKAIERIKSRRKH